MEDEVSSDGPLIFCGLAGRGNRYLMVPFAWNEIVPVSYTHLDVYKRQVITVVKLKTWC